MSPLSGFLAGWDQPSRSRARLWSRCSPWPQPRGGMSRSGRYHWTFYSPDVVSLSLRDVGRSTRAPADSPGVSPSNAAAQGSVAQRAVKFGSLKLPRSDSMNQSMNSSINIEPNLMPLPPVQGVRPIAHLVVFRCFFWFARGSWRMSGRRLQKNRVQVSPSVILSQLRNSRQPSYLYQR